MSQDHELHVVPSGDQAAAEAHQHAARAVLAAALAECEVRTEERLVQPDGTVGTWQVPRKLPTPTRRQRRVAIYAPVEDVADYVTDAIADAIRVEQLRVAGEENRRLRAERDEALVNARCGQLSTHAPHVVRHGPDQPRNCPGVPYSPPYSFSREGN